MEREGERGKGDLQLFRQYTRHVIAYFRMAAMNGRCGVTPTLLL